MFLGWYDPDKKKTVEQKIAAASRRYERKWGSAPSVALVNPKDLVTVEGLEVRPAPHVAPNTIYVGEYEDAEAQAA
jgi:hypothetical protein